MCISEFDRAETVGLNIPSLCHQALEAVQHAVLITDLSGMIRYANPASHQLCGLLPKNLVGRSVLEIAAESDRRTLADLLENPISEPRRAELSFLCGDQGSPFRLSLHALNDPQGNACVYVFTSHDLSERQLLEKNLRQAQKLEAVGLLASGLAHNINSPLAAIIVTAEMAQARYPAIKEFRDIMQAADRIQEIVANLMTKSRQEQSTEEMDIDLNQLVKTELKFLEANLFFKHQVSTDVTLDPNLPRVRGLYSDFSQCFYNLVQNALDAMQEVENRNLTVKTALLDHGQGILLSVRDSGCGIPAEHLPRIFEPFFTTKQEITGDLEQCRPSGTGLGLSTTKHLLSRYGAQMDVISEMGRGTEFRISVPIPVAVTTQT